MAASFGVISGAPRYVPWQEWPPPMADVCQTMSGRGARSSYPAAREGRDSWWGVMIVIQMHGEPGSGKSTLARAIGRALPAVVLDKDVIGAALMEEGLAFSEVGKLSYAVIWRQLDDLLREGHDVIVDSPCFWPVIEERGRAAAARWGGIYRMVECRCTPDEIDRRLASRNNLPTQPGVRGAGRGRPGMYTPACERLVLDSTQPVDPLAERVLTYVGDARRGRAITRPVTAPTPGARE